MLWKLFILHYTSAHRTVLHLSSGWDSNFSLHLRLMSLKMLVGCVCVDEEASVGVKLRIPSDKKATLQHKVPKTLSVWNDFPRK